MLVSYFRSCLHPIQVSSSHCAIDSPLSHLNIGLFEGNCRTEEPAECEWNERNFCSSFSGAEYIIYAFSLSTWCFDMKLLKVLRSESMESPGLKILTNSHIFWALHHNKMTPKLEESEFIDPKAEIICKSRKKLHRTRYLARSFSLFNTIAAFYTHSVQGWAIDRALMCDGCFPSNDIAYMEI